MVGCRSSLADVIRAVRSVEQNVEEEAFARRRRGWALRGRRIGLALELRSRRRFRWRLVERALEAATRKHERQRDGAAQRQDRMDSTVHGTPLLAGL